MEETGIVMNEEVKSAESGEKVAKKINWADVWDRFTTGLLLLFFASPFLVLLYIFLWFVNR